MKKQLIFIGGFESSKINSAAHLVREYYNFIGKSIIPSIILSKDSCTDIMPSLVFFYKGVGLTKEYYLQFPEYLHLIQDKEYEQFLHTIKHLSEVNDTNIIATGNFLNFFSCNKMISDTEMFFSLLNYDINFYFLEREEYYEDSHKSVVNLDARKFYNKRLSKIRKIRKINTISDDDFISRFSSHILKKIHKKNKSSFLKVCTW